MYSGGLEVLKRLLLLIIIFKFNDYRDSIVEKLQRTCILLFLIASA